jgi:hypothetical protein
MSVKPDGTTQAALAASLSRAAHNHVGKEEPGAPKSRAYVLDGLVFILRTRAFETDPAQASARGEQSQPDVLHTDGLTDAVEELTGRQVAAVLTATHRDPDVAFDLFVLSGDKDGSSNA